MNKLVLVCLLIASTSTLFAQQSTNSCFDKNYNRGVKLCEEAKFEEAYDVLRAAKYGCPDVPSNSDVDDWIIKAQEGYINIINAEKEKTQAALLQKDSALQLANTIIDAFYFYDDSYALAFKDNVYGFINKKGEIMIDYRYDYAQSFDYTGFAKVTRNNKSFLIDTAGTEYRYYNSLDESIVDAEAYDLSGGKIDAIPANVFAQNKMKLLFLRRNRINKISPLIKNLDSLLVLDIADNNLEELPPTITQLANLKRLNLNSNNLINLELDELRAMTELSIASNKLEKIPAMKNLEALVFLNISNNELTDLLGNSGTFSIPQSVRHLDLSNNNISEIPAAINQLIHLEYLNLSGNPITELPRDLSNLERLKVIRLEEVEMTAITTLLAALSDVKKEVVLTNTSQYDEADSTKLFVLLPQQAKITADFAVLNRIPRLFIYMVNQSALPSEFLKLPNVSHDTWDRYGQQFQQLKNYSTAIHCYKNAYEVKPLLHRHGNIGECYRLSSEPDSAIIYYEAFLRNNDQISYRNERYYKMRLAQQHFSLKQYPETVAIFTASTTKYPEEYRNHFFLGYYAIFTGQYELAINSSKKSLELAPNINGAISNLVLALVQNNQFEEAQPYYVEWKDREFLGGQIGSEVFRKDIEALQEAGIVLHPDFIKVNELLETVRK